MASATLTQYRLMARAVPRVAPLGVVGATGAVMTLLVISTADPAAAQSRLRLGAACVAASLAFVVDDEAAHTLAGSPATLRARRGVRALVAFALATAAFAVMMVLADARSGVGRPEVAYLLEFAAIACIALGVGSGAVGRSDDGRGGAVGAL
ncbi:MAG: hypothetical protein Q8K63_14455, partial [Acidimicrobiales bacterium]|nr:hypothetical protein [Acidimicrobiales bacterium]